MKLMQGSFDSPKRSREFALCIARETWSRGQSRRQTSSPRQHETMLVLGTEDAKTDEYEKVASQQAQQLERAREVVNRRTNLEEL
jgi:hypothetical protein